MKNIMKFWALAFCSIVFAVSCEKETEIVGDSESIVKAAGTYTIEFPTDPDSKVSLASDGKTAWEAGDQIFIHGQKVGVSGDNYYSRIVTLSAGDISADGKTASFTLDDIVVTEGWRTSGYKANLFAAYPASAVSSFSDGTSWYYSTAFSTTDVMLLGGTNDTSVNDGKTFTFTNLSGVISFIVDGDYDSCVFTGNGGAEVVGYEVFAVRIDSESSFGDKNKIPYNGASGGVGFSGAKTSITASIVADGTTENRIYFPGGVNLTSGFTIKFMKGGVEQKRISTATAKNIARGKYLKLGDITSHLYTYVPPAVHNSSIDMAGAEDLSASASANCYIVNAGEASNANKVFSFKAYKGKGMTNVGAISSVSVLWATYNTDTAPSSTTDLIAEVDYDKQAANDYYEICFKMPSVLKAGNAVIAAKDDSDNILWSWHIWMPSSAVTASDYGLTDAGQTFMDRNLGALTVAEASADTDVSAASFGLFYAWGRKDPFPGLCSLTSSSLIATTGSFTMNGSKMSVAASYSSPMTMVATGADANYTWTTDTPTAGLWGSSKTMNDPCPPGYVVPEFKNGKGLWAGKSGVGFEVNETHKWFKMGESPNYIVFPIVGYIDGNLATAANVNRGSRVYVWSSTATSTDGLSYNLRVNKDGTSSNEWQRQARAGSIRCVAE